VALEVVSFTKKTTQHADVCPDYSPVPPVHDLESSPIEDSERSSEDIGGCRGQEGKKLRSFQRERGAEESRILVFYTDVAMMRGMSG
jgi:hypothetical protein